MQGCFSFVLYMPKGFSVICINSILKRHKKNSAVAIYDFFQPSMNYHSSASILVIVLSEAHIV